MTRMCGLLHEYTEMHILLLGRILFPSRKSHKIIYILLQLTISIIHSISDFHVFTQNLTFKQNHSF